MLTLKENEKIILALHRHWVALLGKILLILILIFAAFIGSVFFIIATDNPSPFLYYLFWFGLSVYLSAIYLMTFIFWMDYYLDMWIVTNERILDIEHFGIFRREVSEFLISQVQDVTVEIPGMMASFLRYGNIRVQTAGEKSFAGVNIPHPDKAKDVIIHQVHLSR